MHLEHDCAKILLVCEYLLKTIRQWVQMDAYQKKKTLWADLMPLHFCLVLNLSDKEQHLKD